MSELSFRKYLTSISIIIIIFTCIFLPNNIVSSNYTYQGFKGINLGNFLEAPNEGDWSNGILIKEEHFTKITQAGFNLVRLPIRWNTHAMDLFPYNISNSFFDRVDWVINKGLAKNLSIIINIHHYNELMIEPEVHKNRFLALWNQIASHYQNYSNKLIFEVLNEPNDKLNSILWNEYLLEAIEIIRMTNPNRTVIIGPANWNNIWSLDQLTLPQNDSNIVVTFHYYSPFEFTHQGAEWVAGSNAWLGTNWTGSQSEVEFIRSELDIATNWAKLHNKTLFLGEFGAYQYAYMNGRIAWTTFIRSEIESCPETWGWAYWEFCSGFGIIDSSLSFWYKGLLRALLPESPLLINDKSSDTTTSLLSTDSITESYFSSELTTSTESIISSSSINLVFLQIIPYLLLAVIFYKLRRVKTSKR